MNIALAKLNEEMKAKQRPSPEDEMELREYATHAPITYDDARQFLTSLGHPFVLDDTMKMLAEMRRKYAEEMLRAMKKTEQA